MKHVLELILKRTHKDWDYLVEWLYENSGIGLVDERVFYETLEECIIAIFEHFPKYLTLLVIDLAKELWEIKCTIEGCSLKETTPCLQTCIHSTIHNQHKKVMDFIFKVPDSEKVSWLVRELES